MDKTCERCGKPFTIKADPFCPDGWASKLAKMVHYCQRCADYGWSRLQLHEGIQKTCFRLAGLQRKTSRNNADEKIVDDCLKSIGIMARSLAVKCCEFYRVQFTWDDAFPEMICQNPDKAESILNTYERGIRKFHQTAGAKP